MRVTKGSMVIMKGRKVNGLYVIEGKMIVGEASVTDSGENKTRLWYLRLGYMSERRLKELQR